MQILLTWTSSCLFVFCFFLSISSSFDVVVYGVLLLLLCDDGAPSSHLHCIITQCTQTHTPIHINTHTLSHKHTPPLLCSKLNGHILGLRAPWGSILPVLRLKIPYLHYVSYLSSVLSCGKGKLWAHYFIGWMEQYASIQLWAKGYGLWFSLKHIKADYYSASDRFPFVKAKSKTQIKPVLVLSVKVYNGRAGFTLNRVEVLYSHKALVTPDLYLLKSMPAANILSVQVQ